MSTNAYPPDTTTKPQYPPPSPSQRENTFRVHINSVDFTTGPSGDDLFSQPTPVPEANAVIQHLINQQTQTKLPSLRDRSREIALPAYGTGFEQDKPAAAMVKSKGPAEIAHDEGYERGESMEGVETDVKMEGVEEATESVEESKYTATATATATSAFNPDSNESSYHHYDSEDREDEAAPRRGDELVCLYHHEGCCVEAGCDGHELGEGHEQSEDRQQGEVQEECYYAKGLKTFREARGVKRGREEEDEGGYWSVKKRVCEASDEEMEME